MLESTEVSSEEFKKFAIEHGINQYASFGTLEKMCKAYAENCVSKLEQSNMLLDYFIRKVNPTFTTTEEYNYYVSLAEIAMGTKPEFIDSGLAEFNSALEAQDIKDKEFLDKHQHNTLDLINRANQLLNKA